jgi:glycogen operon protein
MAAQNQSTTVWPGRPYPLGATWDGAGVNFALFSRNATAVELCLFDDVNGGGERRIRLPEYTDYVWHGYLPEVRPNQLYGYRVYGAYAPEEGLRFNPHKLLLDPNTKAVAGELTWDDALFGYTIGHEDADLSFDERDSAPFMPKAVVVDTAFSWDVDHPLRIPWHKTLIYELHVKGFTAQHPDVPPELRGTYAALTLPAVIDYLHSLGVTAVELMPVHFFINDHHLVERGLSNYWGYNTLGFFTPEPRYAHAKLPGEQVVEFKSMVKTLHREGIEVILDVVYNHTAEGNELGPTLSFKGIDNLSYYRLVKGNERYCFDYTGTGNTLNAVHPRALQMIMDSLRYWVSEMHVDGFRFDLAAALARGLLDVDRLDSFFDIIHQDPVLSQVKLIAEPWDVGEGGYQVGNFPVLWAEWNGEYRDTVRRFWKGDIENGSDIAYRLTGSPDLYELGGRHTYASINFVTSHDGFTLHDLVSYNKKHNEANGNNNEDGDTHNNSWNFGVEGPTDDAEIIAQRQQQMRNFMATLLLSQGIPMIRSGDEFQRTQMGNNNTYCQDNPLSWLQWTLDERQQDFLHFTRFLTRFYHQHPVLRRRKFFQGTPVLDSRIKDLTWFHPEGEEISDEQWQEETYYAFGLLLAGNAIDETDERGNRMIDDTLLILFNASPDECTFILTGEPAAQVEMSEKLRWQLVLDTRDPLPHTGEQHFAIHTPHTLAPRSLALFLWPKQSAEVTAEGREPLAEAAYPQMRESSTNATSGKSTPAIGRDLYRQRPL